MGASYVYKRRKLRNSVALLSDENGLESGLSVQPQPEKSAGVVPSRVDGTREGKLPDFQKLAVDYNSVNDSCSSSKSNVEEGMVLMKIETEDVGECSSSDTLAVELSRELASAKDLCISVLGAHGQLGGDLIANTCTSVDVLGEENANLSQPCKVCGVSDKLRKMLICDLCEEAFHPSCCRVKKLPVDDWFCPPCFRKKPKVLPETISGKLFDMMSEEQRKRLIQGQLGPISFMLKDTQPYTSGVRIGKDFQVEVPNWTGPISGDYDCFGEPSNLDPAECDNLNGWNFNRSSRPSSIGNWLQCREVIYNEMDESDEGVVCGKWRRTPLFVSQTEDWDCSCAVIWDPIHADCAVPQELETSEVLKHLKYIELLKPRLANRNPKPGRTKREGFHF